MISHNLAQIPDVIQALLKRLSERKDEDIHQTAINVLAKLKIPDAQIPDVIQALLKKLSDSDWSVIQVREAAVNALAVLKITEEQMPTIVQALLESHYDIAVKSIGLLGIEQKSFLDLIKALQEKIKPDPVLLLNMVRVYFSRQKNKGNIITKLTRDLAKNLSDQKEFENLTPKDAVEFNKDITISLDKGEFAQELNELETPYNLINAFAYLAFNREYENDSALRSCFMTTLWNKESFISHIKNFLEKDSYTFLPILLHNKLLLEIDRCEKLIVEKIDKANEDKKIDDKKHDLFNAVGSCDIEKSKLLLSELSVVDILRKDKVTADFPIIDQSIRDLKTFLFLMQFDEPEPTLLDKAFQCSDPVKRDILFDALIQKKIYTRTDLNAVNEDLCLLEAGDNFLENTAHFDVPTDPIFRSRKLLSNAILN